MMDNNKADNEEHGNTTDQYTKGNDDRIKYFVELLFFHWYKIIKIYIFTHK
jgi:hypothetical protein